MFIKTRHQQSPKKEKGRSFPGDQNKQLTVNNLFEKTDFKTTISGTVRRGKNGFFLVLEEKKAEKLFNTA